MPTIQVGGKTYEVKPDGRVDHVKLGKGVRVTQRMNNGETLQDFEQRVQRRFTTVQVRCVSISVRASACAKSLTLCVLSIRSAARASSGHD